MSKYEYFFDDEAFEYERGVFKDIEDKHICNCEDVNLLYCHVHNKYYVVTNGVKTLVENSNIVIL